MSYNGSCPKDAPQAEGERPLLNHTGSGEVTEFPKVILPEIILETPALSRVGVRNRVLLGDGVRRRATIEVLL